MVREFSTNTNLLAFNAEHIDRDMDELIAVYATHGIRYLDLNFCEMMRPVSRFNDERALSYINRLKELKAEHGLSYIQAHAPYPVRGTSPASWEEKIIKAMNWAYELGCPHIVVHPQGCDIEENIRRYERLLKETDITIAIENMESGNEISRSDEINEIIRSNPKRLKALFDTGHANIMGLDLGAEIKAYGSNLVGLHVHDNNGREDQHLFPFMGNIRWRDVIAALEAIGYDGYLTYEAMYFSRKFSIKREDFVIAEALNSFRRLF